MASVDSGQVVNPDGQTNQIEGEIMQSMSWTLYESVTFDDTRITSIDWQTYPILQTGGPAAASIANAIANATGKRLRDLPLTRKRIKDAMDA